MKRTGQDAGAEQPQWIFYDSGCGLCHGMVRVVLSREEARRQFRFAPLGGRAFSREIEEALRSDLPDSVVVKSSAGEVLTRSEAAIYVAGRMGNPYRWFATAGRLLPSWILDLAYDGVAAARHRFFSRPAAACPEVPESWRARFDD